MKLFLAPLQGLTVAHYRNIYAELFGGIDAYYAPFITTNHMRKTRSSLFKDIEPLANKEGLTVVPQLLSNNGEDFKFFATTIAKMGYEEVNWNIGCPYPTVTKKIKGSGIMPYPDMVRSVLDEACKGDTYKVSVKMRLGLHDLDEGLTLMELLNTYPLKNVIIHGRTGDQKYNGTVDLDSFEALYRTCNHEVIYNGDIYTYEDYVRISDRFPEINSFMLGRGALRDPFLPSIIKNNGQHKENELVIIRQLHDEVFAYYEEKLSGDRHLIDRMKEFWIYLSTHMDSSGKLFKKIKKCKNRLEYLTVVSHIFASTESWR